MKEWEESSLYTGLSGYTKDELKEIAKTLSMTGYTKFKKEDLIPYLAENILTEYMLGSYFMNAYNREIKFFENCMEKVISQNEKEQALAEYFLEAGYLFIGEGNEYIVPSEVKELYKKVNTEGFQRARKRHQLLVGYCFAAVNLYAVVSIKKVVEIFNEQNTAKTHIEEMLLALEKIAERSDLVVLDPETMELYNNYLYNSKGISVLKEKQGDKPYYIPPREVFLKYADEDYITPTRESVILESYIMKNLGMEEVEARELCGEISFMLRVGCSMQYIVNLLKGRGINFTDQLTGGIDLLMKLSNTTRVWANRGFTAKEMVSRVKTVQKEQGDKILPFAEKGKIYPNEPCPCGSGKKYKQCCGKKENGQ